MKFEVFKYEHLDQTDMLVLASPVYWFGLSAQIKCFIDRMYAFAKKGYPVKSIALLLNSGENKGIITKSLCDSVTDIFFLTAYTEY